MTRKEYMEQLRKYLKRLPKEDYENAIEYFSEYFDEAGPENEQQVMEELGEPKEAARELLLNLLQESVGDGKDSTGEKETELPAEGSGNRRSAAGQNAAASTSDSTKKKRSPGKIILLAILVLCASPVSLALMFSALAVLSSCDCIRDLFSGCGQHRNHSRRNHGSRFWSHTDSEICGSSLHDGWWRISYGRSRNPGRSAYHIYL